MQSLNVASPVAAALAVAVIGLGVGCASTPPSPLQQAHNDAIRRLTIECYWEMEGERLVFGSYPVHTACRRWAERRVQVRMPPNVPVALD